MTKIDKKWFRMQEIDAWRDFYCFQGFASTDVWRKAELGGIWKAYYEICEKFNIPEGRYWENEQS